MEAHTMRPWESPVTPQFIASPATNARPRPPSPSSGGGRGRDMRGPPWSRTPSQTLSRSTWLETVKQPPNRPLSEWRTAWWPAH